MPHHILIIDDDNNSRNLITRSLENSGYNVTSTNNGPQGIHAVLTDPPDLIILDLIMPDISGLEILRQLKHNNATHHIPILVFTSQRTLDQTIATFEAGASDVLIKGCHPSKLTARIKTLLRNTATHPTRYEHLPSPQGHLIAIIGANGGVGASTLSANLAAAFAPHQHVTLTDPHHSHGALALTLGLQHASNLAMLLAQQPANITQEIVQKQLTTHTTKIRLLLTSTRPKDAALNINPDTANTVLDILRRLSQIVIADLGHGIDYPNTSLLTQADHIVIATANHPTSLSITRELIKDITPLTTPHQHTDIILINSHTQAYTTKREAERLINHQILATLPNATDLLLSAIQANMPAIAYQPTTPYANHILQIAEHLLTALNHTRLPV